MTEVFVVAPANSESGGPELCHQLVHTLNTATPGRAAIVYYPFELRHKIPDAYRRYDVPVAMIGDITPGATVVLPETYGGILDQFPACRIMFWWMSVNNFHRVAHGTDQIEQLRHHADSHLYQSEYARRFLEANRLGPAHRLSDQLADNYIAAITTQPTVVRRDVVAFNPAKGQARTEQILHALTKGFRTPPKVIALQGLSRDEMMQVLSEVKVYIDFGEHPGKDRLPREAAALGCCVLTNRRGSAGNRLDVPIPSEFKIDDRKPGFECRAANKIHALIADFDQQAPRFDAYREIIALEPVLFAADVRAVFSEQLVA